MSLNVFHDSYKLTSKRFIAGIGVDLLSIERVEKLLKKNGSRFAAKILGGEELQLFYIRKSRNLKNAVNFLSSRFAMKEAFSKALGIGMTKPMAWREIQVFNSKNGKPEIVLSSDLSNWYEKKNYGTAHISASHDKGIVTAYVVIEYKFYT